MDKLALKTLAKAQALLPDDAGEPWLDIGAAFLEADQSGDAESCLRKAEECNASEVALLTLKARLQKVSQVTMSLHCTHSCNWQCS